ncbi:MAG: alpha-ketoglutarate-dependent dioxygenase AlkB [Actinobacteria bacterium]|nr:alpha-ketoglutarate-dependent dioxygenase AlkB [Actinomycetota bacterium]
MARARTVVEQPEGLVFRRGFLSEDEEHELLAAIGPLEFRTTTMRGQTARRTVRHYGYDYDYESYGKLVRGQPLPDWLTVIRNRGASFAGVDPDDLVQALVSRYPPDAPIGWHRDAPMFGVKIVGVSLRAASRMCFQRTVSGLRHVLELELPPRSAYVLAGAARSAWQHSIPPVKELRYSITFRRLRSERWVA